MDHNSLPCVIPTEAGATQEARLSGGIPIASPTSCRIREFAQEPLPRHRAAHSIEREVLFSPANCFFFVPNQPLLSPVPISRSSAGANATKGESEMGTRIIEITNL